MSAQRDSSAQRNRFHGSHETSIIILWIKPTGTSGLFSSNLHLPLLRSLTQPNFIPRRDPARNQHPGSTFSGLHPPVHFDGSYVQSAPFREIHPAAFTPRGPLTVAPGGNAFGNQKPGTNTGHSARHGIRYHSRNSDPYVISLSLDYEPRVVTHSSPRIAAPAPPSLPRATKCRAPAT